MSHEIEEVGSYPPQQALVSMSHEIEEVGSYPPQEAPAPEESFETHIEVEDLLPEEPDTDTALFYVDGSPPWAETILLAFQHYIVELGSTTLVAHFFVPRMGGTLHDEERVVQAMIFISGVNTMLQSFIGLRLPIVMGYSFAYTYSALSIIKDLSDPLMNDDERFVHTIRAFQGGMIVSSLVTVVLGYAKMWGKLTRYIAPVVIVPSVFMASFTLLPIGNPLLGKCMGMGLPSLALVAAVQLLKFIPRTQTAVGRFSVLIGVGLNWSFLAILTAAGAYKKAHPEITYYCQTHSSDAIASSKWIRIPYPFQWGPPIFRASGVIGMLGAALVSSAESIGMFYAASRLANAPAPPSYVISRSIGLQGLGQLLNGIWGGVGATTACVANVSLLGTTRVGSRRVVQLAAVFMLFFSIFGKFGAFFASIPYPVFLSITLFLHGMAGKTALSVMQFVDNKSERNKTIIGVSIALGTVLSQYFEVQNGKGVMKTNAGWFNDIMNAILSSAPTIAIIVATLLHNFYEFRARDKTERGSPWWLLGRDTRITEVYKYPFGDMKRFIPGRFH